MTHPTLTDLVHRHMGRPGVAMGGGLSLPSQIPQCPADAVWISANDHGAKLREVDYIAVIDRIEHRVRPFGKPLISIREWADYRVLENPAPNSGVLAAMILWVFGCAPIIAVGMDCYDQGTYWHDPGAVSTGRQKPVAEHLGVWRRFAATYPGMYRTIGNGPLSRVFPAYDSAEPVQPGHGAEEIRQRIQGRVVRFTQTCTIRRRRYQPGDEAELLARHAEDAVKHRRARYA